MYSKTSYLVDTENVGASWKHLLAGLGSKDKLYVFYTDNSPHVSYQDLLDIMQYPDRFEPIKCYAGKNGLDFQLVSYLGLLLKSAPKTDYVIVSKDAGYDPVCKFWGDQGYCVCRKTASVLKAPRQEQPAEDEKHTRPEAPALEAPEEQPVQAEPAQPEAALPEKPKQAQVHKSVKASTRPPQQKSATPQQEQPPQEQEPVLPENAAAILTAAIPEEYAGDSALPQHLVSLMAKLHTTKLQTVYTAFIAKFGQNKGLALYRAVKPQLSKLQF